MGERKGVVLIGAAGHVASHLSPTFGEGYDLVLLDIVKETRDGQRIDAIQIADFLDASLDANRAYFQNVDAVVHCGFSHVDAQSARTGLLPPWLSGHDPRSGPSDADGTPTGSRRTSDYAAAKRNIDICYHVLELGKQEGVPRVVVASSNQAACWYEPLLLSGRMDVLEPETLPLSSSFYGWAKIAYEHLGFLYACGSLGVQLEVVMIRVGAFRPLRLMEYGMTEQSCYRRDLGAWVSPRDLRQLFHRCVETKNIGNEHGILFQVFYGISNNARGFWSLENARNVVGYAPEDDSEREYMEDIATFLREERQ